MDGIREKLATYIRAQADWRGSKAAEHPDDLRNERCAGRLRALAEHVEKLSDDDPNLLALDSVQATYRLDQFAPSEEGQRMIFQFGFFPGTGEEDFDTFLTDLVTAEVNWNRELDEGGQGGG
jgi:hypothetical protein